MRKEALHDDAGCRLLQLDAYPLFDVITPKLQHNGIARLMAFQGARQFTTAADRLAVNGQENIAKSQGAIGMAAGGAQASGGGWRSLPNAENEQVG